MEQIMVEERKAIIDKYLTADTPYRKSGAEYGIDFRCIHSWVMKSKGKSIKKEKRYL